MPYTTYVEGLLGLLFLIVASWSVAQQKYGLLAFHGMLATGYLLVFYLFLSILQKNITMGQKILFVYDAEMGFFNKLSDFAHKIVSPSTY